MTPTEMIARKLASTRTLTESAKVLENLLSEDCEFLDDGTLVLFGRRHLVEQLGGLRITINANEHPPPHFHVWHQGMDASFLILDCEHLKGNLTERQRRAVKFWFENSKALLIGEWNKTRPSNCPVGEFIEP